MRGESIGPNTPLRLADALELAFPAGGMTITALRRERDRGTLDTFMAGGREFTTLADINRMIERCRERRKGPDCGSDELAAKETVSARRNTSSSTVGSTIARDAARLSVQRLKERSLSTSRPNTSHPGENVTRLKLTSPT